MALPTMKDVTTTSGEVFIKHEATGIRPWADGRHYSNSSGRHLKEYDGMTLEQVLKEKGLIK